MLLGLVLAANRYLEPEAPKVTSGTKASFGSVLTREFLFGDKSSMSKVEKWLDRRVGVGHSWKERVSPLLNDAHRFFQATDALTLV